MLWLHANLGRAFMYYAVNRACIADFPEAARRIMGL